MLQSDFYKSLASNLPRLRKADQTKRKALYGADVPDEDYSEGEEDEYHQHRTTRSKRRKLDVDDWLELFPYGCYSALTRSMSRLHWLSVYLVLNFSSWVRFFDGQYFMVLRSRYGTQARIFRMVFTYFYGLSHPFFRSTAWTNKILKNVSTYSFFLMRCSFSNHSRHHTPHPYFVRDRIALYNISGAQVTRMKFRVTSWTNMIWSRMSSLIGWSKAIGMNVIL